MKEYIKPEFDTVTFKSENILVVSGGDGSTAAGILNITLDYETEVIPYN